MGVCLYLGVISRKMLRDVICKVGMLLLLLKDYYEKLMGSLTPCGHMAACPDMYCTHIGISHCSLATDKFNSLNVC